MVQARNRITEKVGGPSSMLSIFDGELLQNLDHLPVCIQTVYGRSTGSRPDATADESKTASQPEEDAADSATQRRGPHLIVMQHGWYASSFDMRLLRAYVLLLFPGALVLSSQANEENSEASIAAMGARLAHEVRNFIMHRCPELASSDPAVGRLSFFGHSAGSVIVRAALASPLLRLFAPKLYAFVSLSSSHLGGCHGYTRIAPHS